jgi:sortase A
MSWLRVVGKFLISVGVGVLLFVAWTLWGTGIYTAQQQHRLEDEFADLPPIPPVEDPLTGFTGPSDEYKPSAGDPVFALEVPEAGVRDMVVQGVETPELKLGPGHYPDCRGTFEKPLCTNEKEVWPGEQGRVIVSGHRTTYGREFWDLDKLESGDEITARTQWGNIRYEVTETRIVDDEARDIAIADPPGKKAEIVLTTCNPKYSAAERLVVFGEMVGA